MKTLHKLSVESERPSEVFHLRDMIKLYIAFGFSHNCVLSVKILFPGMRRQHGHRGTTVHSRKGKCSLGDS